MTTDIYSPAHGSQLEHAIVRALIAGLKDAGFEPVKVFDGGEYVQATTERQVLDAVFSVGVSTLHFSPRNDAYSWGTFGVLLVAGNERDIIGDCHRPRSDRDTPRKRFCEAVDEISDRFADA
jgi:hypothetical protein